MNPTDFILIEVKDNEIHMPERFETKTAAQEGMKARFMQVTEYTQEDIDRANTWREEPETHVLDDNDGDYLSANWASCTKYGERYDWKIFSVTDILK